MNKFKKMKNNEQMHKKLQLDKAGKENIEHTNIYLRH